MKKFLETVFKISLFEILLMMVFTAVKYAITITGISEQIESPFIFACLAALLLFVIAVGIAGRIEDKWQSFDDWKEKHSTSPMHILIAAFVRWGQIVPISLGYLFFAYVIAPTSISFFLVLASAFVIRNALAYLLKKDPNTSEKI